MVLKEKDFLEEITTFGDELLKDGFISYCEKSLLSGKQYKLDDPLSMNQNHEGIYLFQIKHSSSSNADFMKEFTDVWKKREPSIVGNYPKSNIRDSHAYKNSDWLPLYLGISKKLHDRISLHISNEKDRLNLTTWALKLKRSPSLKDYKFQYSFIEFKGLGEKYFLCEILELQLRARIKPIIGA